MPPATRGSAEARLPAAFACPARCSGRPGTGAAPRPEDRKPCTRTGHRHRRPAPHDSRREKSRPRRHPSRVRNPARVWNLASTTGGIPARAMAGGSPCRSIPDPGPTRERGARAHTRDTSMHVALLAKEAAGMGVLGFYSRIGFVFTAAAPRRGTKRPYLQNKDNMNWCTTHKEINDKGQFRTASWTPCSPRERSLRIRWSGGRACPIGQRCESRGRPGRALPSWPWPGDPGWLDPLHGDGRHFPPEEIGSSDGKPSSAAAKAAVLQG